MTQFVDSNSQIIGLFVSSLIFFWGLFILFKRWKYQKNGLETNGVISDVIWERGKSYPVVSFKTKEGIDVRNQHTIGSNISIFTKGEHVEILYMKDRPERYIIRSKKYIYIAIALMIIGISGIVILKFL